MGYSVQLLLLSFFPSYLTAKFKSEVSYPLRGAGERLMQAGLFRLPTHIPAMGIYGCIPSAAEST